MKCHPTARTAEKASFAGAPGCLPCHTDRAASRPERPVYKVADFVFFSHAKHYQAKIECARCHGDVAKHDRVAMFRPTSMKACVDCHKAEKASIDCNVCHELSQ